MLFFGSHAGDGAGRDTFTLAVFDVQAGWEGGKVRMMSTLGLLKRVIFLGEFILGKKTGRWLNTTHSYMGIDSYTMK